MNRSERVGGPGWRALVAGALVVAACERFSARGSKDSPDASLRDGGGAEMGRDARVAAGGGGGGQELHPSGGSGSMTVPAGGGSATTPPDGGVAGGDVVDAAPSYEGGAVPPSFANFGTTGPHADAPDASTMVLSDEGFEMNGTVCKGSLCLTGGFSP